MAQHQKGALDELHDLRLALGGRQVAGQLQLGDALVGGGRRARDDGVVELADAGFGEGGVPLLVVAEQAGPDDREFVQCMQAHGPNSAVQRAGRSEEYTSELQSLMRISYAVFCLKKKNRKRRQKTT